MNIEIVRMNEDHINGIVNVENNSFSIPWSEKSFRDELKNDLAVYFTALTETGNVAGYMGLWNVAGQGDITNIAVLPEFRKSGIGSKLLESVISYAKKHALSKLTLEVRASNTPAKSLYSKFGFKPVGIRKKYYRDNREDAVIMELNLNI